VPAPLDGTGRNAHLFAHEGAVVQFECNTAKIKARLLREGWQNVGGSRHDKFRKFGFPAIMVPRHRVVTPGVAASIARAAGWAANREV